ncbi:MAG: zinc and cadmium transporter [Hydrogenophaga sp.]
MLETASFHDSDRVVLRQISGTDRAALVKVLMAGTVTAIGGVTGYFLLSRFEGFLPYFLVLASSSFVYVALADLSP